MDAAAIVARFAELSNRVASSEALETPDGKALLELIHEDYALYENGRLAIRGPEGVAQRIRALKAGAPGFRQVIVEQVVDGDTVVARWTMSGFEDVARDPIDGMTWAQLHQGQLYRVYQWWENAAVAALIAKAP